MENENIRTQEHDKCIKCETKQCDYKKPNNSFVMGSGTTKCIVIIQKIVHESTVNKANRRCENRCCICDLHQPYQGAIVYKSPYNPYFCERQELSD